MAGVHSHYGNPVGRITQNTVILTSLDRSHQKCLCLCMDSSGRNPAPASKIGCCSFRCARPFLLPDGPFITFYEPISVGHWRRRGQKLQRKVAWSLEWRSILHICDRTSNTYIYIYIQYIHMYIMFMIIRVQTIISIYLSTCIYIYTHIYRERDSVQTVHTLHTVRNILYIRYKLYIVCDRNKHINIYIYIYLLFVSFWFCSERCLTLKQ